MQPARQRQQLRSLIHRIAEILEPAFQRTPITAGKVSVRRTRCGKPNCRCVQGHLHAQRCLARWRGEGRGTYAITEQQAETLGKWTEDYRRLREARAEVRRWSKAVLGILREVERLRTVSEEELRGKLGGGVANKLKGES